MKSATQGQILDKVICISFYTNAPGKGMNLSVFFSTFQLWVNNRTDTDL